MRNQTLLERAKRMRREATPPERALWRYLKSDQMNGAKFRRQVVIGPYIADFACRTPLMLVVELDGDTHGMQENYDAERSKFLEGRGYRVLRFANRDVLQNIESVLETIAANLNPRSPLGERYEAL
jgi:very-short-patch-repair endonuclease